MQVRVAARMTERAEIESSASVHLSTKRESNAPRAAFVVAKKLAKASGRNRLRRQMREAYRLNPHRHNAKLRDLDLIFLAAPAAFDVSPQDLREAMNHLFERAIRAQRV